MDPYDLQRFVDAQHDVYAQVLRELGAGRKQSHWMWFVFPQIQGLGSSAMARRYALASLAEAGAYARHPLLGARLRECTELVNRCGGADIEEVFGFPDHLKYHSCMTLFARAADDASPFLEALRIHFEGRPDVKTLERLP